jgi:hypothetical protein
MFRVVFWDILLCKMIVDRRFRGAYCLHHQEWQLSPYLWFFCNLSLMSEVLAAPSVSFLSCTWCHFVFCFLKTSCFATEPHYKGSRK